MHLLISDGLIEEHGDGRLAITEKARRMLQGHHPEEPTMIITPRSPRWVES